MVGIVCCSPTGHRGFFLSTGHHPHKDVFFANLCRAVVPFEVVPPFARPSRLSSRPLPFSSLPAPRPWPVSNLVLAAVTPVGGNDQQTSDDRRATMENRVVLDPPDERTRACYCCALEILPEREEHVTVVGLPRSREDSLPRDPSPRGSFPASSPSRALNRSRSSPGSPCSQPGTRRPETGKGVPLRVGYRDGLGSNTTLVLQQR